jgi:DegV family protein with EDD domain
MDYRELVFLRGGIPLSKVIVVTDSTAGLPKELAQQHNIRIAPQVLIWNGDTYLDQVDIQPEEYYNRLAKATVMPTTSQVTPKTFNEIFSQAVEEGYDILAVLISEKLSGTIASAVQARDFFPGANIEIVDSRSTSMALGFPVLEAARLAQAGGSLAECKTLAEEARQHTGIFLTVDTLEFLYRGGRIGGGARFLGTALNIKPILELRDGRIEAVERVRTRGKALNRVIELVEQHINSKHPVRLASLHANAYNDACYLLEKTSASLEPGESFSTEVSPVVGTHAGPGTVGICWMAGM